MNPTVTITLEASDHSGKRVSAQTAFCYSQRHTAEARGAIEALHSRLVAEVGPEPRAVLCSDGFIRVRKR